jgi:hypothetical protein
MTRVDEQGRVEPPLAGDELAALLGFRDRVPPWTTVDWDADPGWESSTAADDSPEEWPARRQRAVDDSRVLLDSARANGGLDQRAQRIWEEPSAASLRWASST